MKNMKIVCFGDSNTWGYDPRGYFGGQYDHPWPQLLADRLGCTVVNLGQNGREIPRGAVQFPMDTDILIVTLGTNDLLQGASAEIACGRMEKFLRTLDADRVLLITPPPMKPGLWVSDEGLIAESRSLADHYRELAGRMGIRFADAGRWNVSLAFDGVHLTEAGHSAFAEELSRVLPV